MKPTAIPKCIQLVLIAVAVGLPTSAARAADAELATPYQYRVVLRIASHRLLTPTFRRHLRDDLQDGVQAALGALRKST